MVFLTSVNKVVAIEAKSSKTIWSKRISGPKLERIFKRNSHVTDEEGNEIQRSEIIVFAQEVLYVLNPSTGDLIETHDFKFNSQGKK